VSSESTDQSRPEDASGIDAERDARTLRSRTIRFVVVFAVLVLTFLTSYRYAMNTDANMWYLYQVSHSTAWVLDLVGHSSDLEPQRRVGLSRGKRLKLAQWQSGEEATDVATLEVDDGPLTSYESWLYRAYSLVRDGGTLREFGPTVNFVAAQGTASLRQHVKSQISEREAAGKTTLGLEEQLAQLDEIESAEVPGPALNDVRRDRTFAFQVVPDCGAIPSMSIFVAAVLAFPALIAHRLLGVLGGLAALYTINITRLVTLAFIGAYDTASGGKWFRFAHEYVWQGVFIIFVVAIWMAWIELVVKARRA